MYSIAIYIYMFCVNLVAIFNHKARLLMIGHSKTYDIMRRGISKDDKIIWFHAASLGEFEQGRPLIEKIRANHPGYKILLTFFSPSGYEVRKDYKGADVICYLPFDTKLNARKFLKIAHPSMAFFIKYEFWQNYLTGLHRRGIPAYSVASIFRPNQIFFRWYGHKYRNVLRTFAHLFVQNQESVDLLRTLGVTNTSIVGDTRMDRVLQIKEQAQELPALEYFCSYNISDDPDDEPIFAYAGKTVPKGVFVAGSSWQPDEEIFIRHFLENKKFGYGKWKMIIAPHVIDENHLQQIENSLDGCNVVRYTKIKVENDCRKLENADCMIIDCYGLLSSIYRYATIAYVGGGFGVGIHNVPEAAVYGVPVIIGPNNQRFREARDLIALGGCFEIHNAEEFSNILDTLTGNPDALAKASKASADYVCSNAGAVNMIYNHIFQNPERA